MSGLQRLSLMQCNRPVDVIRHWVKEDYLELNPPYQRGDVWGVNRRRNLIRSVLLGVPIPSIIINNRFDAHWKTCDKYAVIDGKQRITSFVMFYDDRLSIPGGWLGIDEDWVVYSKLERVKQRKFGNAPLAFSEGVLPDIESEKQVFDLVNFGGLQQGEVDAD